VTGRTRTRGFTLLEVMVALAILAMGLLAVSDLVSGALRNQARAARLETANLLARAKLAEVEDGFERKGFRDFDQEDEGTFEKEGHPEVRWKVHAVKPQVDLGPERILQLLGGGSDLAALLGQQAGTGKGEAGAGGSQPQTLDPRSAAMTAVLNQQLTLIGEQIKKGVREVRLTVSWPDGKKDGSFTVVTHVVVLNPKENP
jgi:general secretion pathway protein I